MLRGIADWLWGYDFFISNMWVCETNFPEQLVAQLNKRGFRCFLDKNDYDVGNDLDRETVRQIGLSKKLIVVVRPSAVDASPERPRWVLTEIDVALKQKKELSVIDLNGALQNAPDSSPVKQRTLHWLQIRENLATVDRDPSLGAIDALARSYRSLKRQTRRAMILAALSAALLVLLGGVLRQTFKISAALRVEQGERLRAYANYIREQPQGVELSALLAAESLKLSPNPVTIADLQSSLSLLPAKIQEKTWRITPKNVAVSANGATVVALFPDGKAEIYAVASLELLAEFDRVAAVGWSPESSQLASAVETQSCKSGDKIRLPRFFET